MYCGDVIASYKQITYSDASIIISLFKHDVLKKTIGYEVRNDGEVAVFVRESASLVTGKTDKMNTDHEASSARTDLAR